MKRERKIIDQLANEILSEGGYRVFVSGSGTYGFYTDNSGKRVVSFQVDYGTPVFSGNYRTNQPELTGKGWRMSCPGEEVGFHEMINAEAPAWATRGATVVKYTTLEQFLETYQPSSKFVERYETVNEGN